MYSFDIPKYKFYIIIFLLFSTELQMVTKFAGVQKRLTHWMKPKKEHMTLGESLLRLADI